jgi:hypothetical protein
MTLYFMACPDSEADAAIMQERFEQCTYVAAHLAQNGFAAYCPMTMTYPMNQISAQVNKKITWPPIEMTFMEKCDELIVLTLEDWQEYPNVIDTVSYFKSKQKKVWTYDEFATEHNL